MGRYHYTAAELARAASKDEDDRYAIALSRASLELGYYSPRDIDRQSPHDQDEVYVIVRGRGRFENGGDVVEFQPGDALFVPAGVEHRFLDFTEDTQMWVVFYGPSGGENE